MVLVHWRAMARPPIYATMRTSLLILAVSVLGACGGRSEPLTDAQGAQGGQRAPTRPPMGAAATDAESAERGDAAAGPSPLAEPPRESDAGVSVDADASGPGDSGGPA